MAYVKTRTTKAGSISTTLVEAYRDASGRPRQRMLANLHGEPDALSTLAKLAARRDALRKEQDALTADAAAAAKFYEIITSNALQGKHYSPSERKEIDTLMRQRDRLLARMAKIETDLAAIQRDGAVIKKHCSATPAQVQAAIKAYQQKLDDAEARAVGAEYMLNDAKAKLRRLQSV